MHYTQYIYLTYNVCDLRNQNTNVLNKSYFSKKIFNYLIIIILYSLVMTLISLFGKYEGSILKSLIVIPIIGQMLHFYLDSQLWKFSEKDNRDNTLIHLTRLIK